MPGHRDGLQGALEDNVLVVVVYSDAHAPAIIRRVDPKLFSDRPHRIIAEAAYAYFQKYREAPREHIRDLLEPRLARGDEGRMLLRIVEAMVALAPVINAIYVMDQLDAWIEERRLTMAAEKTLDLLGAHRLDEAREAFFAARPIPIANSEGIWLSDAQAMTRFMDPKDDEYYSSGIDALDVRGIRPARKRAMLLIAPAKIGKTWFLIGIGKANIFLRHPVLHITLEMPEEEIAQRYVQSLYSMSKQEGSLRVPEFIKDDIGACISIDFDTQIPEVMTSDKRADIIQRLSGMKHRSRLLIKEFPSGTLTIPHLCAFFDELALQHNFKPSLVILDYPKLMKLDSQNIRIDLGQTLVMLRGLSTIYNFALCVVAQGNRGSAGATTVRTDHVQEDWSQIGTADVILTLSRTEAEKALGLARVFVQSARFAPDGFMVMISQSYATGQFCLDSTIMTKKLSGEVAKLNGGDDTDYDNKSEPAKV